MKCPLCDGAQRVLKAGATDPIPCPKCDGEGEVPTKTELARAIAEGRATVFSPAHSRMVKEVRELLRRIAATWT